MSDERGHILITDKKANVAFYLVVPVEAAKFHREIKEIIRTNNSVGSFIKNWKATKTKEEHKWVRSYDKSQSGYLQTIKTGPASSAKDMYVIEMTPQNGQPRPAIKTLKQNQLRLLKMLKDAELNGTRPGRWNESPFFSSCL